MKAQLWQIDTKDYLFRGCSPGRLPWRHAFGPQAKLTVARGLCQPGRASLSSGPSESHQRAVRLELPRWTVVLLLWVFIVVFVPDMVAPSLVRFIDMADHQH
jgi:hypothetical protein